MSETGAPEAVDGAEGSGATDEEVSGTRPEAGDGDGDDLSPAAPAAESAAEGASGAREAPETGASGEAPMDVDGGEAAEATGAADEQPQRVDRSLLEPTVDAMAFAALAAEVRLAAARAARARAGGGGAHATTSGRCVLGPPAHRHGRGPPRQDALGRRRRARAAPGGPRLASVSVRR